MKVISHADLHVLWVKGLRNGAFRKLSTLKKGLFSAALAYTKLRKTIINSKLIVLIEDVAAFIKNSIREKIIKCGLKRATRIVENPKITNSIPVVRQWVNCDSYIFWLGTAILEKNSWIRIK